MWLDNLEKTSNKGQNCLAEEIWNERKIFSEKIENVKENIYEIDMSSKQEDLPRKNLKMKKISEYQEISDEQFEEIKKISENVFFNVKYNNIKKLSKLIKEKEKDKDKKFLEIFEEIDFSDNKKEEWTNCIWMSRILQEELKKIWIKSFIIWFKSTEPYLEIWHTWLVVPFLKNWKKSFLIIDLASDIFKKEEEIEKSSDENYPFFLNIKTKDWYKKDYFNPYNEFLNFEETMNKDVIRVRNKFSIIKTTKNKRKISINIDFNAWEIKLLNTNENYKRIFSFEKFENFKNLDESYFNEFAIFCEDLWENPEELYKDICEILKYKQNFLEEIKIPSLRK